MADIEIEIDGRKLTAKPNQTVIEVADAAGIYIPRFCYHKHLSVAANCRMCLVEVEKSPKTLPACATPVAPGMKVFTQSPKTIEAQRAVMEFLLINHPLDCPVCDQGGECELQDLSMGYGASASHYNECKRAVGDEDLGPLIATEMTRCILCTRCVRFGDEVAGLRELGITERGGHAEISTYVKHAMHSEVSGNIIDLCPVGALTSKPYRFTARAWELDQAESVSPHDCLGANLAVHTRYGRVMRVVARENNTLNQTWLSDRDRFSYEGLYHADRLGEPMIRVQGEWRVVEWQKAFEVAVAGLHEVINEHGADKMGALVSPNATTEECYLLQKIMRGVGSPHIDHRLREQDMRDQVGMPVYPGWNNTLADLEQSEVVLLVGTHITHEAPLVALRIRAAARARQTTVLAVNMRDADFNFPITDKRIANPQQFVAELQTLLSAVEKRGDHPMARHLLGKQKVTILTGIQALHHPDAAVIRSLVAKLAQATGATWNMLTDGANSAGAWLAGAVPHRLPAGRAVNHTGLNAYEMLEKPRKAYLLLNVEPDRDVVNTALAQAALRQAKCVIAFSQYRNPVLEAHAHVIFPVAPFTETSGTYVNAWGQWQSVKGVAAAFESSRPAWKVLRVLGNFLHLDGFQYESTEQIKLELAALIDTMTMTAPQFDVSQPRFAPTGLARIGEIPIYALDSLVRRAPALQAAQTVMLGEVAVARLHPDTAAHLQLIEGKTITVKQGTASAVLPVVLDACIPTGAVWVAGGLSETASLGDLWGAVELC